MKNDSIKNINEYLPTIKDPQELNLHQKSVATSLVGTKQNNFKKTIQKTPQIQQAAINSIQSKLKIPNEKLEQERLKTITKSNDLSKVNQWELSNHISLRERTPDDYYKEPLSDPEYEKRLNEAFGPKTDFSISNFENNYNKFNKEEKEMFTQKMQIALNKKGYTGKDGFRLKTDGILGENTKKALDDYKKDNSNDYKEAVELRNSKTANYTSPLSRAGNRDVVLMSSRGTERGTIQAEPSISFDNNVDNKNIMKISQTPREWLSSGEENRIKIEKEKMQKRLNDPKIKEKADKVIRDNAEFIIKAAKDHGVNPGILAACIYSEHRRNMEFNDYFLDSIAAFFGRDTSLGVSQVLMSTAKSMEELGYMPKIALNEEGKWGLESIGYTSNSEIQARIKALEDPQTNIMYAAAYLKYIQDAWKQEYPEIDGRTAILGTLYNIGVKTPHPNPEPNEFGKFAKENYYYVRELMGI